jgi:hypothetical protein
LCWSLSCHAAAPLTKQVGHADLHLSQLWHGLADLAGDDVAASRVGRQLQHELEPAAGVGVLAVGALRALESYHHMLTLAW